MHDAGADRAKSPQAAEPGSVWPELDLVESRSPRLLASQAEEPTRSTGLFAAHAAALQEVDQVRASDDRRVAALHRMQSILEPMSYGARSGAGDVGCLPDIVGAQAFDPPGRVSSVRQET